MGKWHTVEEDEALMHIAKKYGFRNWEAIYNAPENKDFRKKRPDPDVLYKGDKVWIPDVQPGEFKIETGKTHTFTLPEPTMLVQFGLEDYEERTADARFELWVEGSKCAEGAPRKDGLIHEEVPVSKEVEVRLWLNGEKEGSEEYEKFVLKFGDMDPIETVEGVQHRLNNLGYYCGDEHGTVGDETKAALIEFQDDMGLPTTGEIDEKTKQVLQECHDNPETE